MELIWEVPFWCEKCKKDVTGRVYRKQSNDPLPEDEKPRALELLKHYHQIENHTTCWSCGKNIKPHEIADLAWYENTWKDLCRDCAEKSD